VALVDEVGSVVLPDAGRGVLAQRVEESRGVGLAGELMDVVSSAQRKAVTSLLVVSWPPVILQRKTRT
jgi:hypothetical protein